MKNTDDVLDEVLGVLDPVENELGIEKMLTPTISRPSKEKEDVDADYEYQRENFYNLIEKGQNAIEGILNVAKESDHPRGYEVAGNLIKQVSEVTEKLGDLQEKMKRFFCNIEYTLYRILTFFYKIVKVISLIFVICINVI